jgi:hypothetical protein
VIMFTVWVNCNVVVCCNLVCFLSWSFVQTCNGFCGFPAISCVVVELCSR